MESEQHQLWELEYQQSKAQARVEADPHDKRVASDLSEITRRIAALKREWVMRSPGVFE